MQKESPPSYNFSERPSKYLHAVTAAPARFPSAAEVTTRIVKGYVQGWKVVVRDIDLGGKNEGKRLSSDFSPLVIHFGSLTFGDISLKMSFCTKQVLHSYC